MACIQPSSGWGSSPRVRGTPERSRWRQRRHGIIPACAGNTPRRSRRGATSWDHPRVCGEHLNGDTGDTLDGGSSPRVRGTLEVVHLAGEYPGIIPACAGNTRSGCPRRSRTGDHPRVCGEHVDWPWGFAEKWGSSPRVRGTRGCRHGRARRTGIIPACAGNTTRPKRRTG